MADAPSPPDRARPRLDELDVLRVVAAVAVVLIHTSAAILLHTPPHTTAFQVAGVINQLCRFAVPAFVLIAGAGLVHNYGQRTDVAWSRYYVRRLKSIGIPYLFWSIVYFAVYLLTEHVAGPLLPRFLTVLATATAIYTFYFFRIIIPFYLLFPLLRPLLRDKWVDTATLVCLLVNGLIFWLTFPLPKLPLGPTASRLYPYASDTPLWWMGSFFLGAWLARRWDRVIPWLLRCWSGILALAGMLLVWVMGEFRAYAKVDKLPLVATSNRLSAYAYGLVVMVAIIGMGTMLVSRGDRMISLIRSLGRYSFPVYLIHPLIMEVTTRVFPLLGTGPLVRFALESLLALCVAYLLGRLIERVPGGPWVLGIR